MTFMPLEKPVPSEDMWGCLEERVVLGLCWEHLVRELRKQQIMKLVEIWMEEGWGMWTMRKSKFSEYFLAAQISWIIVFVHCQISFVYFIRHFTVGFWRDSIANFTHFVAFWHFYTVTSFFFTWLQLLVVFYLSGIKLQLFFLLCASFLIAFKFLRGFINFSVFFFFLLNITTIVFADIVNITLPFVRGQHNAGSLVMPYHFCEMTNHLLIENETKYGQKDIKFFYYSTAAV